MTGVQTDTAAGQRISPFAAGVVLPIAAVTAVLHCVASLFGDGYWFDEVYMLAIGRNHLDWGSADQPPLAPALAALTDAVAPGSLIALRLPAVLATAGAVVVAGLIARELGCDRRAQGFTAAVQATGAWTTLAGHWLTPYTLEPVQWLLVIWLLVRWVRLRDDRLLLALGVVTGVAALTKFQVLLLCVVLVAAVAVVGPRELLRRRLLWVGAGVAALLAAPTLVWQHIHGWPQLRMAPVVAGEAEALYGGRPGIAVQLVVFAGVAGVALVLYGLWRLLRDDELGDYRFIGVAFVVLYVVFVATADAYGALPQAQRDRTAVVGESYIVAAYLDGYAKRYQLPEAYSTNRSYGYFPPPPADHDTVLYIGREPGALRAYFADMRRVGDVGEDMHAYLLTGQRQSWDQMWPQLRTLTVS